jgi:hypothetical protein
MARGRVQAGCKRGQAFVAHRYAEEIFGLVIHRLKSMSLVEGAVIVGIFPIYPQNITN